MKQDKMAWNAVQQQILRKVSTKLNQTITQTNNEICSELRSMYVFFIDDFYSYKTLQYVRHGEDYPGDYIGVGRGHTFYYANHITTDNSHGEGRNKLHKNLDYEGMISVTYQHDTQDDVLDWLLNGYRYKGVGKPIAYTTPAYHGALWDVDRPTILESFECVIKNIPDIANSVFAPLWQQEISSITF